MTSSGSDVPNATSAMAGVTLLAWLLLFRGLRVNRIEGLILIAAYGATLPLLGAP